jgi:hypothetical protein
VKLDLTKADTGRIIDYWLGGTHNFEVDRVAAAKIEAFTASAADWVRAQRLFLQRAVRYMTDVAGIDRFLVAGSGLPTCGNVHEVAPQAQVVYSDISPVTIAYGQNILNGNPRVRYIKRDAHRLNGLEPHLFGASDGQSISDLRLGIIYVGVAYFFTDPVLRATFPTLYDWAGPGSHLAISFIGRDAEQHAAQSLAAYAQMGNPLYPRTPDEICEVIQPWRPTAEGIAPTMAWGDPAAAVTDEPIFVYGVVSEKPTGG